jgi:hypothetical protein
MKTPGKNVKSGIYLILLSIEGNYKSRCTLVLAPSQQQSFVNLQLKPQIIILINAKLQPKLILNQTF